MQRRSFFPRHPWMAQRSPIMHTLRSSSSAAAKTTPALASLPVRSLFAVCIPSLVLLSALSAASCPCNSRDDEAVKAKVAQLVKDLDASKAAARQSAQEQLIQLGAEALPHLPALDGEGLSAEQKRRLGEIRAALGGGARAPLEG